MIIRKKCEMQIGILPLENNTTSKPTKGQHQKTVTSPQKKDFIWHDFKLGAYYNVKNFNSLFWNIVGKSG